jgi:hypothetical protein
MPRGSPSRNPDQFGATGESRNLDLSDHKLKSYGSESKMYAG